MNNIRNKAALKALFSLFLTLPLLTIEALANPWYHDYFHKLNGINYTQNCSLIDRAQKIRCSALLAYYRTTYRTVASINKKFTEFENWLLALEQEALSAIKQKYGISDSIWHECLMDIERVKNSCRNAMLHPHADTVHDDTIPADMVEFIIVLLRQNNINPQSINIKMVSNQATIAAQPNTIAQATMFMFSPIVDHKNNLQLYREYIPATINIFPRIYDKSAIDRMSCCAHEVQHLVSLHSITERVLIDYLAHYCSVDAAEFRQSKEYHKLSQIHEAQAEIFAAIKSPEIAHNLKAMRKKIYYPNHLYEEHFCHLSTIAMLWNIHAKLSSIQQTQPRSHF
ncbi:MAG TPA: hypothetical protein VJJ26_02690 [Candidatus Babeliales bacterium]|nr:hypothetical protein [Candidatus Babeliales bacterium]